MFESCGSSGTTLNEGYSYRQAGGRCLQQLFLYGFAVLIGD